MVEAEETVHGKKAGKGNGKPIPKVAVNRELSPVEGEELINTLQVRFEKNMNRHEGLEWSQIEAKLAAQPEKLASLNAMESNGGEPDVVGYDDKTSEYIFYDCAAETPNGRRNIYYDGKGQAERVKKGIYPSGNAIDLAAAMGIELLNEAQYRVLQELGEFDTKTSSWIQTPADIRKLGGALFCDRRYNTVFLYHNGAQSLYSGQGFRGSISSLTNFFDGCFVVRFEKSQGQLTKLSHKETSRTCLSLYVAKINKNIIT